MAEVSAVNWSIYGAGNVGGSVIDMLAKPEVAANLGLRTQPEQVLRKDGWHEGGPDGPISTFRPDEMPESKVLFVAAPSTEDHEPALSLMRDQLSRGRTVVTAEKGVLAQHFEELTELSGQLGYWATVGGGTKLIPKLEYDTRDSANIKELHLATNATLTYIFSEVASGGSLDEVVHAAGKLGYAEPGATGAYDVIHNEAANDVPRKIAIVLQTIFPEFTGISLDEMATDLPEKKVLKALNKADKYRYLVSVYPKSSKRLSKRQSKGRLGGFQFEHEDWRVIAGLQRVDRTNPLGFFKVLSRADGGYYIDLGADDKSTMDGRNYIGGSAAGGDVTANTMLDNYDALREAA